MMGKDKIKYCRMCGKEIKKGEYYSASTGRPVPTIKQKFLYANGVCNSCLQAYNQRKQIKSAVNDPEKRSEYKKELEKKD